MKLGGALTEVERDGTHLRCGGGARLPSVGGENARAGDSPASSSGSTSPAPPAARCG